MKRRPVFAVQPFLKKVRVFEVGPRDGLQNESRFVGVEQKLEFIRGLKDAGLQNIEAGAFVREDRVPQMKDSPQVFERISKDPSFRGPTYWALVPNRRGLERAVASGARAIGLFLSISETFNQKNIGMTVAESLGEIQSILMDAQRLKLKTRAYLSTVYGCPFEGLQKAVKVSRAVGRLLDWGVDQVSLGDTIGVATPRGVDQVLSRLLRDYDQRYLAVHFHDTRGTALVNAYRAMEYGIESIDSSAGGLGGCPFAPGATGNLATEDLVYMLEKMKVRSGVDLEALSKTSLRLAHDMGRPLSSRYLLAYSAECSRS